MLFLALNLKIECLFLFVQSDKLTYLNHPVLTDQWNSCIFHSMSQERMETTSDLKNLWKIVICSSNFCKRNCHLMRWLFQICLAVFSRTTGRICSCLNLVFASRHHVKFFFSFWQFLVSSTFLLAFLDTSICQSLSRYFGWGVYILVPPPRLKSHTTPVQEEWSLNHWTGSEIYFKEQHTLDLVSSAQCRAKTSSSNFAHFILNHVLLLWVAEEM